MGNRQRYYDLELVEITALSSEGKGIAKPDEGKVIFVKGGVPGDIVNINVKKSKKNFEEATINNIVKSSPSRIEPFCENFGICGGCKTQHLSYEQQLYWKQDIVEQSLKRIGKLDDVQVLPIIDATLVKYYRNKLDYAACNKRWLSYEELRSGETFEDRSGIGFHLAGMFDKVLHIEKCYYMISPNDNIRNLIYTRAREMNIDFYDVRNHTGVLRNLIFRNNVLNEWMVCVIVTEINNDVYSLLEEIKTNFPEVRSLLVAENKKLNDSIYDLNFEVYHGEKYIYEYMGDKKFKITPKSFFQTNTQQSIKLYDTLGKMLQIGDNQIVYDLYCGVGSIGIYLAENAKKIVGIDIVDEAIHDARFNAEINGYNNCKYFASDMKDIFTAEFQEENGQPDIIIVDPPRAGLHDDVVSQFIASNCPKIGYVSCNPQTMAKNLKDLSEAYTITQVQPVDMFPNTMHIESIAILEKK